MLGLQAYYALCTPPMLSVRRSDLAFMLDSPSEQSGRDERCDTRSAPVSSESSLDQLKRRIARSDRDAFEQTFRRLSPRIFRFVRGMVASDDRAYDITQDTFAKLWAMREELDDVESLTAYVFQMARHRVYNRIRDDRVRRDHEARAEAATLGGRPPAPDDALDAELLRDLIDHCIADLPPRQREALTLRRIDGMSHQAIAEVMDISPHTVNNHIVRAMDRLREQLQAHRPDLLP